MSLRDRIKIRNAKKEIADRMTESSDRDMVRIKMKWMPRWAQICGGEVDFDNPYVSLEMKLCDLKIQTALMKHKGLSVEERRESVRHYFTDEEWEIYLHGVDPIDHQPYTSMCEDKTLGKCVRETVTHITKYV